MSKLCHQPPSEATITLLTLFIMLAMLGSGVLFGYFWNRDNVSKMRSQVLLELLACSPEDRSERILDLCMLPLRNCAETRAILDNDEAMQHLNRIMTTEQWESRLDHSSLRCWTSGERQRFQRIARNKEHGCPRSDCIYEVRLRSRITMYNKKKAEEKIQSSGHVCGRDCSGKDLEKCQLQCQGNHGRKSNRLLSMERIKFYAEIFLGGGNQNY
ncbi:hypothetical protein EAE96_007273 [Botrytis aclada]|nr:hypothetical protein EAE96_007273 [Botrytis aclada]